MKKSYLFIFFIVLVSACAKTQPQNSKDVSMLTPEQVVTLYFQSWNSKDYSTMYSLISDGFKKIEPTAKTFDDFKVYMSKFYDTALGVMVINVKETYQNDKEAGVEYKIEITNKDNSKKEFSSTYTLKKRTNGWKLIHPYGNNIDTT